MKKILLIGTGGTICGEGETYGTSGYKSGSLNINKLLSRIPGIEKLADIKIKDYLNIDSCNMNVENLLNLAKYINKKSEEDIDGFVITHGTDTLEETAYFLHLTLKTHKPVVMTGSMRPSTAISYDGYFNLYQAVALAADSQSYGKGVLVVFADSIYCARDVQKISTYRTDAFNQRDLGMLGYMQDHYAYFFNNSIKPHTLDAEFDIAHLERLPKVEILYFHLQADVAMIDFAKSISEGVIIAGAGAGNASTLWNNKIRDLIDQQFPIVRSSRISNGLITSDHLLDMAIPAYNLSPQKCKILLSLALSKTKNLDNIRDIFKKY